MEIRFAKVKSDKEKKKQGKQWQQKGAPDRGTTVYKSGKTTRR